MPIKIDKVNQLSDTSAHRVMDAVHTVMHLYRSQQFKALKEAEHELTHMEHKVLGFFRHHPGATQSDLAVNSGRDKAQLARLIKGLRDNGLLDAEVDVQDRRVVRLKLSEQGRALHAQAAKVGARLAEAAVKQLSDAEQEQLIALLGKLKDGLQ
jgi:DNA-binding MarR family transcriptional regulator